MAPVPHLPPLTRRAFLGGAVASAAALVAGCGGGSGSPATTAAADGALSRNLVRFFPDGLFGAGTPLRLPFGIADADRVFVTDLPATLDFQIRTIDGAAVTTVTVPLRKGDQLPRPYYALTTTLVTPGQYEVQVTVDGVTTSSGFTVLPAEQVPVATVGDRLAPFDTPTVADPRGVDPICTRQPPCPFHEITLTEALAEGRPVAFLVGTPAFCQTATCGPVLDELIAAAATRTDLRVVHADVYTDDTATTPAPVVTAFALNYEPVLWVVGADGVVTARLDVIWNRDELAAALATV